MQLGARMDRGPAAPDTKTPACPRRTRAGDGLDYVKMRGKGSRSLFSVRVAANIAQWAGPSVAAPVTVVHTGAEFVSRAPAPQSNRTRLGPHLPTRSCDKACHACGMDRARGGRAAERGVPDKMRAATRSGKLRPAARPGALGRWAS